MITLINPPGMKTFSSFQMHTPNPPLGLAYIAAVVRQAGYPYAVIDAVGDGMDEIRALEERGDILVQGLSYDDIVGRIPQETRIVGISCLFSVYWPVTLRLASRIREKFPEALLVLGGEHGTAVPEYVLHDSPFDVVVLGEGEETFLAVIRAHLEGRDLGDVPGIAFRRNREIVRKGLSPRKRNVDEFPIPDWESFPIRNYIDRHQINGANLGRSMPLLATRGCPYQCTFCSSPNMWTTRWIARSPALVADEMEVYMKRYDVTNFDFQDLTAIVKRLWIIDFCQEILRRGLKATWQLPSGTRSEAFDEEVARLLYASGCRLLSFAPESGSELILKAVKKRVNLKKMLVSMRTAVKQRLKLSCLLVIGFPQDTKETVRETLKLVRKMAWIGVHDISVTKFVPYPGSELFLQLQREGKIRLDNEFFISPIDFYSAKSPSYSPAFTSNDLYRVQVWMFVNFYVLSFLLRPFRVVRSLWKAVTQGVEETRYAKWFVDQIRVRRRWRRLATR